ncbi:MAG: ABC transporter ATP-binding protein [Planctomycetales bacterium]|nr:ABC transporter ATP-binding protein [Planctomycetales bacterium]
MEQLRTSEQLTANPDAPLLQLKELHVEFGKQHVLRDINLSFKSGQTIVVIGESGCGKTVMLKSIIGLIKPTRGEILYRGRDLATFNEREMTELRTRFGFVFQQAALFDSLTIGQNVAFPLKQHRAMSDEEMDQTVRQALFDVGLPESVIYKRPAELSGGMRKRVGLARALVMDPELMLYDEPTTGLDPIMSDVINELIMRTQRRGRVTSIVITHDMHTARKVADRVIMVYPVARLQPGESQVLFDGPPTELDRCPDRRMQQFVRGEAGERLMEMRQEYEDSQMRN